MIRIFYIAACALCTLTMITPTIAKAQGGEGIIVAGLERPADRPLERIVGFSSYYGVVETRDGAKLRTIVTTPDGTHGPLRPILFTQWVSCGTIEFRNAENILATLAKESGLALIRVERASDGDSIGATCGTLDYDTEVAHYIEAFAAVLADSRIDPSEIFIYGSSLGSTTAPLVGKELQDMGFDIAGVAVQGGGAETYYERMLTFDRHYLERRPDDVAPEDIHSEMISRARFHYEYLINDRHPDDIASDSAAMANVRDDILGLGETEHYGRPFAWHQQAAKKNFLAAWAAIDAPVMVIFNEFDQFEAEYGHKVIVEMVNRLRPETATLIVQENIGHSNFRYQDIVSAYPRKGGETAWAQTAKILVDWFKSLSE
ncbi:MAG: hypothetical protein KJN99_00680 [Marinicaulis sp.]|nr:hypothetical protein [Marinicaulis sp.]